MRVKGRNRTVINQYIQCHNRTLSPSSHTPAVHARAPGLALGSPRRVPLKDSALLRLLPHTQRARVAAHRRRRSSSPGSTLRTHSTTQRRQTRTPALLASLHPPTITVRRRRAADVARNELEAGRMVDKSTSENRGHRHSLGCSLHRPQNRPEPANTGRRGRAMVRPDRLSLKTRVRPGRGAPRAMPAPDGDANSRGRGELVSGRHRLRAV